LSQRRRPTALAIRRAICFASFLDLGLLALLALALALLVGHSWPNRGRMRLSEELNTRRR
jgi:hypothetical protein